MQVTAHLETDQLNGGGGVNDADTVRLLVKQAGTSFYWAMRLLPAEKRAAMFAIYAFCREVDDIADGEDTESAKRNQLAGWRDEISRVVGGRAETVVGRALARATKTYKLREADMLAVIEGMEMDATDRVRIRDDDELLRYCDRVAGAVGRLSVRVFGIDEETGIRLASAQGDALQLTNVLRDIGEDAQRDRLYLPAQRLGVDADDPALDALGCLQSPVLTEVCAWVADLAQRRYAESSAIAARCDPRLVRPAVIMMEVYRLTFNRMVRRGWQRWIEPVTVSSAQKLLVALRHAMI